MQKIRTADKVKMIVEDKLAHYGKLLQEASSDQERHDTDLAFQTLTDVLKDVDKILDSVPYT